LAHEYEIAELKVYTCLCSVTRTMPVARTSFSFIDIILNLHVYCCGVKKNLTSNTQFENPGSATDNKCLARVDGRPEPHW
jgi:hypothetical protein